uniref:Trafficking protein particle complex subunit 9 n=1 Tax=Globodera rostochiensis TaxID=31243 RepID=A0A914GWE5_GLORO
MESILPKPEDHCRIQILVKPLGNFATPAFNRVIKTLERRFATVQVSSNVSSQRQILPKLVTDLNLVLLRFGEFQAFRKIFGLLCIGQFNGGHLNASSSSPDLNSPSSSRNETLNDEGQASSPPLSRLRRSSLARLPPILAERQKKGDQNISDELTPAESKQFRLLKEQFAEIKQSLNDQLVDSRCALFGFGCDSSCTTEFLSLTGADDFSSICDHLESILHELLRSIYFVLESRRLDTSFERMDNPSCPMLPDEEKYRMGLENVKSKAYRRKCIGRLRKKAGDYAFLTGLFEAAVQSYQSAIELLKSTADLLWLAAAYEGWCCAAMMIKYRQRMLSNRREEIDGNGHQKPMHRVQTAVDASNSSKEHQLKSSIGHQRYCSDEVTKITTDTNGPSEDEAEPKNLSNNRSFFSGKSSSKRKAWRQLLNFDSSSYSQQNVKTAPKNDVPRTWPLRRFPPQQLLLINALISRNELSERFRAALENYGRFSFAVYIEYECMMRAVHLLVFHRQFIEVESFLREHTCRFLDDKFLTFNNIMKSNICLAASEVYNMIGFKRKYSFFLRLAVFFRLFIENHSENDYKRVYPILNESLHGYGIGGKFCKEKVPNCDRFATFSLQIKAVHEVCTVAVRAGLHNMAIRHLCFMLESFFDHLDKGNGLHVLFKPLTLDTSPPVLLAPLQLTRIPSLKDFQVLPLSQHLAPKIVDASALRSKIFIYSPFQERTKKDELCWVVDCASEVSVKVQNPLPVDLLLNFSASRDQLELYELRVTFARNHRQFTVRVLPSLPSLRVDSSLKRSPTLSDNPNDSIAEVCVFSGQSYDHTITLSNSSSSLGIKHVTIKIQQPQTCGGPNLIQIVAGNCDFANDPSTSADYQINGLKAGERKRVNIRIFGIDPTSTAFSDSHLGRPGGNPAQIGQEHRVFVRRPTSDSSSTATIVPDCVVPEAFSAPTMSSSEGRKHRQPSAEASPLLERENSTEEHLTGRHDLMPYVGRLLSAEFSFTYSADLQTSPTEEEFVRFAKLPMAVTIVPAVNVSSWCVLAGDSPFSRLVVVDVANETDLEAELTFGVEHRLTVQPKECCRVPLLCPCCDDIQSIAFQRATQQASHMMQMQEIERLRRMLEKHLTKHLEIRWRIAKLRLEGQVPIGSLLSSVAFLRQLVLPSITIDIKVCGQNCATDEDVLIRMGEFVPIRVIVYCSVEGGISGELSLACSQQHNKNETASGRENNNMLICGEDSVPFQIFRTDKEREGGPKSQCEDKVGKFETEFYAAFSHEGNFKVKPMLARLRFYDNDEEDAGKGRRRAPGEEDIFQPALSLNVISKH